MEDEVDGTAVGTLVYEDNEGTTETDVDSNSDDSLSSDKKEVKGVVDSSDDDIELGTVKLTNYIQQHEYKVEVVKIPVRSGPGLYPGVVGRVI